MNKEVQSRSVTTDRAVLKSFYILEIELKNFYEQIFTYFDRLVKLQHVRLHLEATECWIINWWYKNYFGENYWLTHIYFMESLPTPLFN